MKVKEAVATYKVRRKIYTYQDYLELPDDGKRYEIIEGELIMSPAPSTIHQMTKGNFYFHVRKFIEKEKLGILFDAPTDVLMSNTNIVQPDIFFIFHKNSSIIKEANIIGVPDLINEIISPSSGYYDLIAKKEIYETFGVKEYWIVDPLKKRIEIFVNNENKFELHQRLERQGILKSVILQGFQLDLKNIFENE
jgi:Uma2 family endonuclease